MSWQGCLVQSRFADGYCIFRDEPGSARQTGKWPASGEGEHELVQSVAPNSCQVSADFRDLGARVEAPNVAH